VLGISRTCLIIVLLVTLVVGCVGAVFFVRSLYESSLTARLPVNPSIQGLNKGAKLTFIGDSRVTYWASHDSLDARYLGFSGATSNQIELYLTRNPPNGEVAVLQVGVNDLRILGMRPDLLDDIVPMVSSSIQRIVVLLSKHYEKIVVLGVFPVAEPGILRKSVWSSAVGNGVELVNSNLANMTYPTNASFISTSPVFIRLGEQAFLDTLHVTETAYSQLDLLLQESISDAF